MPGGNCALTTSEEKTAYHPILFQLTDQEGEALCAQLRRELVEDVSQTGGHLASNLGAVELTVALHRVFDTAEDRLVFDVGHQCYTHKMLTGRREAMSTLRQYGGVAGFPKPGESVHDAFIAGHASNSVAVALGMARARTILGENYKVIAPLPAAWPTRGCPTRESAVSSFWSFSTTTECPSRPMWAEWRTIWPSSG